MQIKRVSTFVFRGKHIKKKKCQGIRKSKKNVYEGEIMIIHYADIAQLMKIQLSYWDDDVSARCVHKSYTADGRFKKK